MKILLIEDDPTDMRLFSVVLCGSGHSVREGTTAEQAIAEIRTHRPELILTDLRLPGMDGLSLVRRLKFDRETRAIPIVAVTAAPEYYSREAALAAGCDAYIVKPVDTRALPAQLEVILQSVNPGTVDANPHRR
ncbi:MAG: response regulator [Steroidobacteraceae bacterium]